MLERISTSSIWKANSGYPVQGVNITVTGNAPLGTSPRGIRGRACSPCQLVHARSKAQSQQLESPTGPFQRHAQQLVWRAELRREEGPASSPR
eukprot:8138151-Pyramimonas_sp.AAC.1